MPGKSDAYENALLRAIFNADYSGALSQIVGAPASPLTHLYVSLHTADPGEPASDQTVNECNYSGYGRQAVVRTTSGWIVTGNSVSPFANIDFPANGGGTTQVATHFGIGTAASGSSGKILYSGAITPNLTIAPASVPRLTTATTITED